MADPVNECAVRQPSESDGTKLKLTVKEGLDLGEELKIEITADVSRLERNLESHDVNHGSRLASTAQSLEPKSRQDLHDHLQQRTMERIANIPMITRVGDPAVQTEAQQPYSNSKQQPTKQAAQEKERKSEGKVFREEEKKETGEENMKEKRGQVEKEKGQEEREKGGREKEEKEREATEEEDKEVKKDVMDWTVVRRNKRQRKRMVQIFVKMNECKVFPLDVSNEGQAILESEKEAVIRVWEETEEYRAIVENVSGGSDVDVERKMRYWASKLQERPGGDIMECGLRWAVEARRKERGEEKRQQEQEERRRQARQERSKQVRFGDEEQFEETRTESTDEHRRQKSKT